MHWVSWGWSCLRSLAGASLEHCGYSKNAELRFGLAVLDAVQMQTTSLQILALEMLQDRIGGLEKGSLPTRSCSQRLVRLYDACCVGHAGP